MEIIIDRQRATDIKKWARKAGSYRIKEILASKAQELSEKAKTNQQLNASELSDIIELFAVYVYQYEDVIDEMDISTHYIQLNANNWIEDLRLRYEHNEDDADTTKAQDAADARDSD